MTLKIAVFYFLLEASTKKQIWGTPDGTTQMVTNFSNAIMRFFKKNPKDPDIFGGERIGFIEPDRIRYKIASLWDKAIVFVFTWSIGVPLQLAHDTYEKIETALIGEEESHDEHHSPASTTDAGKTGNTGKTGGKEHHKNAKHAPPKTTGKS